MTQTIGSISTGLHSAVHNIGTAFRAWLYSDNSEKPDNSKQTGNNDPASFIKKYEKKEFFNMTDPNEVKNPKRNFSVEELNKEIKNHWFLYRWYRRATYHLSLSDHIRFARNKCNLPKDEYHKLFVKHESDLNDPCNGKICRAYIPEDPKDKPIYIFLLGHSERLNKSPDNAGIVALYNQAVKENRGSALLFRTGFIMDEVSNLNFKGNYAYEHEVVYEHTRNILTNYIKELKDKGATEIKIVSYSWGGGTAYDLSLDEDWKHNLPVTKSIFIDAVTLGGRKLANPLRKRPYFENSPNHTHVHIYQKKDVNPLGTIGELALSYPHGDSPVKRIKKFYGLYYKTIPDEMPGDVVWRVNKTNVDHNNIDTYVKNYVWEQLTEN